MDSFLGIKVKMIITSTQNNRIKLVRSLADKKGREDSGLYIAESIKLCEEAVKKGLDISFFVGIEETLSRMEGILSPFETIAVTPEVFKSVSTEVSPEGILAVIKKPQTAAKPCTGKHLLLDGVKDPGNLGTLIRSAAASGFREIYLLSCADAFSPKTVRASMGGIFSVKIYEVKESDFTDYVGDIYVADMKGENVFSVTPKENFCLALGSESQGVSKSVKNAAYKTVSIPMARETESLNVGVAGSICMYVLSHNANHF